MAGKKKTKRFPGTCSEYVKFDMAHLCNIHNKGNTHINACIFSARSVVVHEPRANELVGEAKNKTLKIFIFNG